MTNSNFAIVIATADRENLLVRTLESIAQADFPSEIKQIIVSDNSPQGVAEKAVRQYQDRLPIVYQYNPIPTKTSSLNSALNSLDADDFVIFFDDDVRLDKECLTTYVDEVNNSQQSVFVGGLCAVDYDLEPPKWIRPYLPSSAKGWSLGKKVVPLLVPKALGFNWGARVEDIRRCGGFDKKIGPGTANPVGDESEMQRKLLASGVAGKFLPKAQVFHYVPKERCSPNWVLNRAKSNGHLLGTRLLQKERGNEKVLKRKFQLKNMFYQAASTLLPISIFGKLGFHFEYHANFNQACLSAIYLKAIQQRVAVETRSSTNSIIG